MDGDKEPIVDDNIIVVAANEHDAIKPAVQRYVNLCESIKNLREEMSTLNAERMELELQIKDYMVQQQMSVFNLDNGKLIRTRGKQTTPLSKDYLKETLESKMNASAAEEITKAAFENRPTKEVDKIKVVSGKARTAK